MRVLIVDDEPLALERLRFALADVAEIDLVGEAADGIAATEAIRKLEPDLVILDIQMPGRTGIAVAAEAVSNGRTAVIFLTAYEHFAPDAFEVEAVDYLIKPVRLDRLRRAVERARRRQIERAAAQQLDETSTIGAGDLPDAEDAILVPERNGTARVPIAMIDWIEAAKDYVLLHTPSRSYVVRMTMSELERRLDPQVMVRVHRSAFVRRDAIAERRQSRRGAGSVVLIDGSELPIGPSYMRLVERVMLEFG